MWVWVFKKGNLMETMVLETTDGDLIEAVTLQEAAKHGLDDADAMGDKSPESKVDVRLEDEHV